MKKNIEKILLLGIFIISLVFTGNSVYADSFGYEYVACGINYPPEEISPGYYQDCSAQVDCVTGELISFDCTYYPINPDPDGGGVMGCDGVFGSGLEYDNCGVCGGNNECEQEPDPQPVDCAGIPGGGATTDDCETCVGGSTGKTAKIWYKDEDNDTWGKSSDTKNCYNPGSGWATRGGDFNDNCYSYLNAISQCEDPCDTSVVRPLDADNLSDILGTVTSFGNTLPGMPELATQLQNGIDVTWNSAVNGLIDKNFIDNLLADLHAVGNGKGLAILSTAGKLLGLGAIVLNVADLGNQYLQTESLCAKTLADFAVNAGSLIIKSNIVGFGISAGWLIIKETL